MARRIEFDLLCMDCSTGWSLLEENGLMRIVGNALLLVAFLIILVPSWDYVQFMQYKKSDALGIPMNIAYFPFVVYLVDMIIRLSIDIAKDFGTLRGTK